MLSSVAVNSSGDMEYLRAISLLVVFFVCVDYQRAVGVDIFQEFGLHFFFPLSLKRGQYCLSLQRVKGFSQSTNAMQSGVLYS